MMGIVLVFTFITSYLSSFLSGGTIGGFSTFMLPLMGIKFIVKPIMITKDQMGDENPKKRLVKVIGTSILIGCVCGFIGAGGGMMMLLVLTSILGYELKTAIGTSVFIMTFTAFTGAASHFVIGGVGDVYILLVCVISTLIWARIAAVIANRVSPKILNRTLGIVLTVLGVGMIIFKYAF